jgi:hypothetical protein
MNKLPTGRLTPQFPREKGQTFAECDLPGEVRDVRLGDRY